jgi:hypothetical protein
MFGVRVLRVAWSLLEEKARQLPPVSVSASFSLLDSAHEDLQEIQRRKIPGDDEVSPGKGLTVDVDTAATVDLIPTIPNPFRRTIPPVMEDVPLALGCISGNCLLRRWCRRIAASKAFDNLVLVLILLNCVSLALQDIPEFTPELYEQVELFFFVAFALEAVIRILALGLIGLALAGVGVALSQLSK